MSDGENHGNGVTATPARLVAIRLTYNRDTDHLDIKADGPSLDLVLDILVRAHRLLEGTWRAQMMQQSLTTGAPAQAMAEFMAKLRGGR